MANGAKGAKGQDARVGLRPLVPNFQSSDVPLTFAALLLTYA